jgi:hypothetical protein
MWGQLLILSIQVFTGSPSRINLGTSGNSEFKCNVGERNEFAAAALGLNIRVAFSRFFNIGTTNYYFS